MRSWSGLLVAAAVFGCRPAASPAIEGGWGYEVHVAEQARELRVEARFGRGSPAELSVASGAEPFVRDVEVEGEGGLWKPLTPRGTSWFAPACREGGCRVRYRFALDEASVLDSTERVERVAGGFVTMPAAWLLRPLFAEGRAPVSLRFSSAPGVRAVAGFASSPGAGRFEAAVDDIPQPPFVGFGAFRTATVQAGGGEVEVAVAPGRWSVSDDEVLAWARSNAEQVASLAGGAPMPRFLLMVVPTEGAGVEGGLTLGNGGASVVLWLGEQTQPPFLARDWVLRHELLHVAWPGLPGGQRWMEEGLATYMEPLLRARVGLLPEGEAWALLCDQIADEVTGPLDGAEAWARMYRGGALFYLALDIEARSGGGAGVAGLFRAVRGAGGSVARRWSLDELAAVMDAPTRQAWRRLYEGVGRGAQRLERGALLARLGVQCGGDGVALREDPGAALRRAMSAR